MPLTLPSPHTPTHVGGPRRPPVTEVTMSTVLQSLSTELADAVESAGRAVVAIHARRRIPASGVHWRPGVVVATNHTISRDENITATLPDGTTAAATLAGRDPGTDLAVLKLAGQKVATASLRLDPPPKVGELVIALGRPGPSLTASWGNTARFGALIWESARNRCGSRSRSPASWSSRATWPCSS